MAKFFTCRVSQNIEICHVLDNFAHPVMDYLTPDMDYLTGSPPREHRLPQALAFLPLDTHPARTGTELMGQPLSCPRQSLTLLPSYLQLSSVSPNFSKTSSFTFLLRPLSMLGEHRSCGTLSSLARKPSAELWSSAPSSPRTNRSSGYRPTAKPVFPVTWPPRALFYQESLDHQKPTMLENAASTCAPPISAKACPLS